MTTFKEDMVAIKKQSAIYTLHAYDVAKSFLSALFGAVLLSIATALFTYFSNTKEPTYQEVKLVVIAAATSAAGSIVRRYCTNSQGKLFTKEPEAKKPE